MYEKPKLERFGTFRELTRIGLGSDGDTGLYSIGYQTDSPPVEITTVPGGRS